MKVLFVCLGNICRSPLAMGYFNQLAEQRGLAKIMHADSAATSNYNIGDSPDFRTRKNAKENGLELSHCARQITPQDLQNFDFIVAMDYDNRKNIASLLTNPARQARKVLLLRDFDPQPGNGAVPDPYYGGDEEFAEVYTIIKRCMPYFMDFLQLRLAENQKQELA